MSLARWIQRIWTALEISSLDNLPSPWFLLPGEGQQELTEDEASELLVALRRRLFDHPMHPTVVGIKHNLDNLSDEERIVLLYVMRYIALKGAGQNRYWPVFHEVLLDKKVPLQRLQVELAPILTEQWLRIYGCTKGKLFRPRQGKRNIKWPLSHAGLLMNHKHLLLQFRKDMAERYNQEEFELLLDGNYLDNFLFELESWLDYSEHKSETFTEILLDGERGAITGELAQQFLAGQPIEDFQAIARSDRGEFNRFALLFNASENQLEFHLTVQLALSCRTLIVRWDNSDFLGQPDATGSRHTFVLPIRKKQIPESGQLIGLHEVQLIRVPRLTNEPLVFDGNNGRRIQQWQPGNSYYIIFPPKYTTEAARKKCDILFEYQQSCGMLKGEWTSYEVVLAQIANLSPAQGRSVEALNNAADTLDLPGFELQWQPQISLVGGYVFQMSNAPRYDAVDPPLIQVQGVWDDSLTIIYERWEENSKSFRVLETTTLPRQQEPKHYILHPPLPSEALRQRHRVRVGDNTLAQWYTEVATSVVHPLRFQGMLSVTFEGEEIKEPTYRHLIESNLNIQAWPFADLTLFGTNGSQQKQQLIHLGDTGNVSLPWRETVLSSLSSGNISISLLWNNLPVSPVVKCLADERIILPDAIEDAFRPNDPDILDVIVEVRRKSSVRLLALVLGSQPWNHEIWSQNMVIDNDGIATASITTGQKEACWIIICAQRNGQKPEALVAKRIAEVSDSSTPFLARPIGPSLRQWQDIVKFISIIPLPIDLYRLVQRQQLYQLLGRKEFEQLAIATWEDISTTAKVERLQNWQQMGVDVSCGLCEWVPADSSRNPYATVLIPDDLSCFKHMINHTCLTADVREIKEGGRQYAWPDGKLYSVDDEGEIILRLRSQDFLGVCIQCRVVLPGQSFSSHQHLCKVGVLCLNSREIADRRDIRVYFAARFDGCDLLSAVARHLKAIVAESADDLPDKITSLLEDKLYNYFDQSGFADERTWLLGLSQAIDILICCLSSVHNSKLTNQEIKKVILYQDALLSIAQWIQEA